MSKEITADELLDLLKWFRNWVKRFDDAFEDEVAECTSEAIRIEEITK